jgi:hypothetical protein
MSMRHYVQPSNKILRQYHQLQRSAVGQCSTRTSRMSAAVEMIGFGMDLESVLVYGIKDSNQEEERCSFCHISTTSR